jgi:hypothetical protein
MFPTSMLLMAVAEVEYELEPGADDEDLGTIKGIQGDSLRTDERGPCRCTPATPPLDTPARPRAWPR